LAFENVTSERLFDVVPAERFSANEPVIVEPFRPKLTPFEFENVMALRFCDVVPALKLTEPAAAAAEAVTVEPFKPKEMLFEFEKTKFERFWLVVPALRLTPVMSWPLSGSEIVAGAVWTATTASSPAEFENASVTVESVELPSWSCGPV
jgi:hypothetical protein